MNSATSSKTQDQQQGQFPFQFRLPSTGEVDPWWSGNRSFWNERVLPTARNNFKPEVKSLVVKQAGRKRGVRFVIFESAKAYFDKLRNEQEAA